MSVEGGRGINIGKKNERVYFCIVLIFRNRKKKNSEMNQFLIDRALSVARKTVLNSLVQNYSDECDT